MDQEAADSDRTADTSNNENRSFNSTDTNRCPICLGPFVQESYLDTCFHQFCYSCISSWAKVVANKHFHSPSVKCPLCKTENFSIIFGYDGGSFQRHYIDRKFDDGCHSLLSSVRLFFSKAHKYRLKCYYTEPGTLNNTFNVSRYWKSHKYRNPNRWLQSWLRRETQALTQEEDVNVIVHHILGVVDSFLKGCDRTDKLKPPETKREEFRAVVSNAVRPFIAARTERFVNELELFLASGLNIEAYDEVCLQQLGWTTPGATATRAAEGESSECTPVVPYLYIFDDDSDETD